MALIAYGLPSFIVNSFVRWRNCVGLGVFIAVRLSYLVRISVGIITRFRFKVKDAIHLLHLWLKKRELESRRVKDRDFSGIDIRELDLLPAFLTRLG